MPVTLLATIAALMIFSLLKKAHANVTEVLDILFEKGRMRAENMYGIPAFRSSL